MEADVSSPDTICLQCGDRGFTNAFVYCVRCLEFAVHRYCMDVVTFDEFVPWRCDDCDVEVQNQHAVRKHDYIPCQTSDHTASENIIRDPQVGTSKNDIVAVNIVNPDHEVGPRDAGINLDLVDSPELANEFCPVENGGMSDELVILSTADERKRCEQSSFQHLEEKNTDNLMQHDKLLVDTPMSEGMQESRGAINIEDPDYDGGRHDAAVLDLVDGAVPANEFCPVENGGMSDELVIPYTADERKRCEQSSFQHLEEEKDNDNLMHHDKLLVDTPMNEGAIRVSTLWNDQHSPGNNSFEIPHEQYTNIDISECAKLASDSKLCAEVGEIKVSEQRDHQHFSQQPQSDSESSTVEQTHTTLSVQQENQGIDPSNYRNESRKSELSEERLSASHHTSNFCKEFSKDLNISSRVDRHMCAEPVITPIWRGSFNIWNKRDDILDGLVAHLSSQACHKVYEEACQFQPVLHLEMLPRSDVWPKSFQKSEPSDNIALYFFPSEIRSEVVYAKLVDEMVHKSLGMRAIMPNAELLVFTSRELPLQYWRLQGKYYLWGVFRQKQHPVEKQHPAEKQQPALCSQSCGEESIYNPINLADLPNDTGFSGDATPYIQMQLEHSTTSKDIMASLKEMFDRHFSARQNVMKRLICSKIVPGTNIRDHIGKMIGFINKLEMLGEEMNKKMKMGAILSSLPWDFKRVVLGLKRRNVVMTLSEVRNKLQSAKDWIKKDKPVVRNSGVGQPPKFSSSKRKRDFGNKNNLKQVASKKRLKTRKSEDSCYHCGKKGHWKRNCHEYLASVKTMADSGIRNGV